MSSLPSVPRIVGICGSLSPDSATRRALALALAAAQSGGAETQLLDLREFTLPFAVSGFEASQFPDVERFNRLVRESDGLIWATPEYHGSFSGVLKNALDLGSFDEYEGKVVALLGVAAGQIGAINALSHLRTVARQLHAWCCHTRFQSPVHIRRSMKTANCVTKSWDRRSKNWETELSRWAKFHGDLRGEAAVEAIDFSHISPRLRICDRPDFAFGRLC